MAEFDCFLTKDEFVELLQAALVAGYAIQVDERLPTPTPHFCKTKEDVFTAVRQGRHAFLLERSDISRYPVELVRVDKEGTCFWYPRAKEGGPVIEAYFFAPFEKNGRRVVPCSLLTYQAKIINPLTSQPEPAGEMIKNAFNSLIGELRKSSRRVKSVKRSAVVTPAVDAMLTSGWVLAPPFDNA